MRLGSALDDRWKGAGTDVGVGIELGDALGLLIAVATLGYLFWTLIVPERF